MTAHDKAALAADTPRSGLHGLFMPVSPGRTSGLIVEQIRWLVRQGQLLPGDRLPSERELCDLFGVSRVTVREALRVLESSGLLDVKVGAKGGAFVTAPSGDRIRDGVADLLTMSSLTASEVTEAREVLEMGIVPLVCSRATEDDLEALDRLVEAARRSLKRGEYTMMMSTEFHIRVAQCAHNGAVELIIESFRNALLLSMERAQQTAPEMGRKGVEEHAAFVAAVRQRDPQKASAIMFEHLERTASRVKGI
jgi:GntR family transcriptional repressor for pyruvate dehydrogenase complex